MITPAVALVPPPLDDATIPTPIFLPGESHGQRSLEAQSIGLHIVMGFPCGSAGKESACNAGDLGSIPGLGRSPGEGHSNPLQYSCLENPMDRGAWWHLEGRQAPQASSAFRTPTAGSLRSPSPRAWRPDFPGPTQECDPIDRSPPGSSIHGIFQAKQER